MRKLLLTALFASSTLFPAVAQPPQVIEPEGQIELAVGEARTFNFQQSFKDASTTTKDIADIVPQSDHTLTISGITAGQTFLFVRDDRGQMVYTAAITVTPSPGHQVKIYGMSSRREQVKDFIGYYCGNTGCGRADQDKPTDPTIQSTTVTQPTEGGGAVSTTRQYGPR